MLITQLGTLGCGLNRGLSNQAWWDLFPSSTEEHLVVPYSDHTPLFFRICHEPWSDNKKFENMWVRDPSCEAVVKKAWDCNTGIGLHSVNDTILQVGSELTGTNAHLVMLANKSKRNRRNLKLC